MSQYPTVFIRLTIPMPAFVPQNATAVYLFRALIAFEFQGNTGCCTFVSPADDAPGRQRGQTR